jgi:4-amino-4-deoxy-L-arabinose transferase-like glycosyltransferase
MNDRLESFVGTGRRGLLLGLGVFVLLVALSWVGFIASDDVTYAKGAYGWMEHFPYVGGHGTIRYPITIPMALSFGTFGENEFAMVLPSLLYLILFLVMAWRITRDVAGPLPAFCALFACVTNPLIVVQSSIANVDVIEMALLFGAWLLCFRCLEERVGKWRLLGAGALVGIAFLTRETAIFVAPYFGLLFLAGHRFNRWQYLWMAAGFLAIWLIELAYLGIMTGDPFYRFNIALHHDPTINRAIDLAGNVIVSPLIDPLLVLLINQEFMLLMFMAIPLGIWLCFSGSIPPRLRYFARLIALFGLCWFLCIGAAQKLLPLNPRYFMITTTMACLLTGIGLGWLTKEGRGMARLAGLGGLILLVGTNLAGIYVENRDPAFGEEKLVEVLASRPKATIATDPMTRYRAELPLRWARAAERVTSAPPPERALYYYNPARSAKPNAKMEASVVSMYQPRPNWVLIEEIAPKPSYLARALEWSGMHRLLPSSIWHKLRRPNESSFLYQVTTKSVPPILPQSR